MKKLISILSIFTIIYSCTKTEPPPLTSYTAKDSLRFGLLNIGQKYGGGIITYFLVSGDPGYDANTPHGLIAAASDHSVGIRWHNGSFTTTGATGTSIGTGFANTNKIIANQGATARTYAAGLAIAAGGAAAEWFLPSKDELNILYMNRVAIGGFTGNGYWSSTEFGSNNAWAQFFNNGIQNSTNSKDRLGYVRLIKAF